MNLITNIRKWLPITLMLLVVACGAITIDVDTEIKDETDITHDMKYVLSGPIVQLVFEEDEGLDEINDEINNEFVQENCTVTKDVDRFEITCLDVAHEDMGSEMSVEVQVTKKDLGNKWEYRATSTNVFFDVDDELLDDEPLEEDIDIDQILRARQYWTLTMPGEIVETNADSTNEDGSVEFVGKFGDERETFTAVSHKDKGFSLLGLCN